MHLLFPSDPLDSKRPDETFSDQIAAFGAQGFDASFCSLEALKAGRAALFPMVPRGAQCLYRGWMVNLAEYGALVGEIRHAGADTIVSAEQYEAAHHLPNWYQRIVEFTAETKTHPESADLEAELRTLGWSGFFVKDYVKSLKTSVGSQITDPSQIEKVLAEMRRYRDQIEGGVCIRRVEHYLPGTEVRYFAVRGIAYASAEADSVPEVVQICASRIPSPFISIDVAKREDGVLRVVEIGDGQVSDLVGWSAERLASLWRDV